MEESTIYTVASREDPLEGYTTTFHRSQTGKEPVLYWPPSLSAKLIRTVRYHDAVDDDRHYRAKFEELRKRVEATGVQPQTSPLAIITALEGIVLGRLKERIDGNQTQ